MLKRLREQLADHGVALELTDHAKELLVEQGYDPAMGARPLRRAIQRLLEDPLADFVLGRQLQPGATIVVHRLEGSDQVDLVVVNPTPDAPPVELTGCRADGAVRRGLNSVTCRSSQVGCPR